MILSKKPLHSVYEWHLACEKCGRGEASDEDGPWTYWGPDPPLRCPRCDQRGWNREGDGRKTKGGTKPTVGE